MPWSQIASKFRTRVGESLTTIEKHNTPLAEATTPSLEALKAYSAGLKVEFATGFAAAVPLFKRAIEIDPKFAMAYATLGLMYSDMESLSCRWRARRKAYELRDHASDHEKFFITAMYDRRSRETWKRRNRPLNCGRKLILVILPHGLLSGFVNRSVASMKSRSKKPKKAIAIDPDLTSRITILPASYFYLDRLERSREHPSAGLRAQTRNP